MIIEWPQIAANACAVLAALGGFGWWYRGYIIDQVRLVINTEMVTKSQYDKDKENIWDEIKEIRKFDAEFATLKTKMEYVQNDTTEIKNTLKELLRGYAH